MFDVMEEREPREDAKRQAELCRRTGVVGNSLYGHRVCKAYQR